MTFVRSHGDRHLRLALLATSMLAGVSGTGHAQAVPTGGTIVAGTAAITTGAGALTVTQSTARSVINWTSFSVGNGATVTFKQPGATSATLNRVTGTATSSIAGQITSNGAIYLVNPNGIALTSTAAVNTAGGFVASTLDIANADFMAGKLAFAGNGTSAAVTNAGKITAGQGAYVALLGGSVANSGTITVPLGKVGLGSGEKVALDINGNSFMQVSVPTSAVGVGALVDNSGAIVVSGGRVELKASTVKDIVRSVVNMSGSINADSATASGGQVVLLGGAGGTVTATGTISARATGATGNGGFVETSGQHVAVGALKVDTTSAKGKTGNWLIDPTDYIVAASGGDMTGAALGTKLATTSVTIAAGTGLTGTNGDVIINDAVSWTSANALTLSAFRNVAVNKNIAATGAKAGLVLRADNTGTGVGTVTFGAGISAKLTGAGSFANIYYNPVTFGTAVDFSPFVTAGTRKAYELVNTAAKLQAINTNTLDNYALSKNIDASTIANFVPLGTDGASGPTANGFFAGSFDGQGFTVDKLTINRSGANYIGLFGAVGSTTAGQTIANLALTNVNISGGSDTGALIGTNYDPYTGYNGAAVSNVSVTGKVAGNSLNGYIGGLIGYSQNAAITGVSSAAIVTSLPGNYIGGLVGYNNGGAITSSSATGSVTVSVISGYASSSVGGLVGYNIDGSISQSFATGAVSTGAASASDVGGLVGDFTCSAKCLLTSITSSYATGAITVGNGASYIGGLAGQVNNALAVTGSYANGNILVGSVATPGQGSFIGGLIGQVDGTSISGSNAIGTITAGGVGSQNVGGLVGRFNAVSMNVTPASISTSNATGAIKVGASGYSVAGLVGSDQGGALKTVFATGAVTAGDGSYYIAGLVGGIDSAAISGSYATGAVTSGASGSYFGGLVGSFSPGTPAGTITTSYATGAVKTGDSTNYSGGLVGNNGGATLAALNATGNVTAGNGSSYIGGLAGYSYGASITGSTAKGAVLTGTGGNAIGGLVGQLESAGLTVSISTSNAIGAVTAGANSQNVGGLAGYSNAATITSDFATGNVASGGGSSNVGGLIGHNEGGTTLSSYANGGVTISGTGTYIGGLFGSANGAISKSNAIGAVTTGASSSYVGGLVGDFEVGANNASIATSNSTGAIKVGDSTNYVGGLVGYTGPATISGSFSTSGITAGNTVSYIGGLVGSINSGSILSSYATGSITTGTSAYQIGGLVGYNGYTSISQSYAQGNVTTGLESQSIGGLVGYLNTSDIDNASAIGTVTGSQNIGGLVGWGDGGLLSSSFAKGKVTQIGSAGLTYNNIGGLIGYNSGMTLQSDYATGAVAVSATPSSVSYVGGLVGSNSGLVQQSHGDGAITGTVNSTYVGGLIGYNYGAVIRSYAIGPVVGGQYVGGLVGNQNGGGVSQSYATGAVSGTGYVGGLLGYTVDSTISSYATGAVTANGSAQYVGGLIGSAGGAITQSYANGAVTSGINSQYVGGLAGQLTGSTSSQDSAIGAVTVGTGSSFVGGLVGQSYAPLLQVKATGNVLVGTAAAGGTGTNIGGLAGDQNAPITQAYATGSVTATGSSSNRIGGLVGWGASSITTAYATGAVKAGDLATNVGGLVGRAEPETIYQAYALGAVTAGLGADGIGGLVGSFGYGSRLNQTYSVGLVTSGSGTTNVGGLIGYTESNTSITKSYWNKATSGRSNMCGVANGTGCVDTAGLTTAQMTDFNSYATTYAGWNFTSVWAPPSQVGQAGQAAAFYPQLYALTPVVVANPNVATRTYGAANPTFSGAVVGGGAAYYAFGPAGDTLPVANLFATAATPTTGVGAYVIGRNSAAKSTLGVAYRVIVPKSANLTINPAPLTLTYSANALNRTYGADNPLLTGTVIASGLVNTDTLGTITTGTAAFTTTATSASGVGQYAVTGAGLLANSANYTFTFAQGAGNATALTVSPASLVLVYGADQFTRTYGAANPALTGSVTTVGLVNGDTLAGVTTGTAGFATGAINTTGVGKYAVVGSGLLANSGNYTFTFAQAAGNASALTIIAAPLTLTYTATVASRLYGAANPALTGSVSALGLVNGETLAIATTGAAAFTSAAGAGSNVGKYAVTGAGLSGSANYTVSAVVQAAANATALTVNPAPLTVTYTATAASRVYGAANPALTGTATATGLKNGQTLAGVTTGTAAFTTAATPTSNVGKYAVTGAGILANSANYAFTFAQAAGNATALTITAAPLTLTYTANPTTRIYGAANPLFGGSVSGAGFVNGDTLATSTTGTAAFTTTATAASAVGSYGINGSGVTSTNYVITPVQAAGNATALTINPAALTITYSGTAASRVYGAANPLLVGTVSAVGLVNSDTLATITTGTATFATSATVTSNVGSYALTGSGLTGISANYTYVFKSIGALTITARALTLTPNALSRVFGAANPTTDTATATAATATTGLVNGDSVSSISVTSPATAASPAGTYSLIGSNAVFGTGLASNYTITYQTNLTGLTVQ